MKRTDLMKRCRRIAHTYGTTIELREGGRHTHLIIAGQLIPVPRHNDVAEPLAQKILRDVERSAKETKP